MTVPSEPHDPAPGPAAAGQASSGRPNPAVLAGAAAGFAVMFAFVVSPRTALYWYIVPLFPLGTAYLTQHRAELPTRWKLAFVASAIISPVALAANWPFSGHVLWNTLFIGHAVTYGRRRTTWMVLLVASLVYLFVMKLAFQTPRDVIGAFIAAALALGALLAIARLRIDPLV